MKTFIAMCFEVLAQKLTAASTYTYQLGLIEMPESLTDLDTRLFSQ